MANEMLMSREEIVKLRDETVAGIEGLNQIRHPIPPEATEMLRAYSTCLHYMDVTLAGDDKVLRCAFCGHGYPDGTPTSKSETLAAHIRVCVEHPIGRENRKLLGACKAARNAMGMHGPCQHNNCTDCHRAYDLIVAAIALSEKK